MPWESTTSMEQKIVFICEWRTRKNTITELCRNFKISRPTAYKLINRFEKLGFEGLKANSKAPSNHPNAIKEKIIKSIINLKAEYKLWNAKKIRELLFRELPEHEVPSVVTVHIF